MAAEATTKQSQSPGIDNEQLSSALDNPSIVRQSYNGNGVANNPIGSLNANHKRAASQRKASRSAVRDSRYHRRNNPGLDPANSPYKRANASSTASKTIPRFNSSFHSGPQSAGGKRRVKRSSIKDCGEVELCSKSLHHLIISFSFLEKKTNCNDIFNSPWSPDRSPHSSCLGMPTKRLHLDSWGYNYQRMDWWGYQPQRAAIASLRQQIALRSEYELSKLGQLSELLWPLVPLET